MAKVPHKWADVIKAFADGADLQVRFAKRVEGSKVVEWYDWKHYSPAYGFYDSSTTEYRVKPEPTPDVVHQSLVMLGLAPDAWPYIHPTTYHNDRVRGELELVFDGETGMLKSVSVINKD